MLMRTDNPTLVTPFWRVAVATYRRFATYRGATVAGVFTNTMFGFIYAFVFKAAHDQVGDIGGVGADQTMLFVFTTQAFLMMSGAFGDREISERIRTGDIAADLYRPVDFQMWWFAHDMGKAAFYAIFRGIPPFVIGWFVLRFPLPTDTAAWFSFFILAALGIVVAFSIRFIANLSAFWLLEARGIITLVAITQIIFGGHAVPLYFMPDAFEQITRLLPFAATAALPAEALLGSHQGVDLLIPMATAAFWIVSLLTIGRLMLGSAQRKLVIQGG